MNYENACKKLTEVGISYTTTSFFSRFYGNRIIVASLKDARKASKVLEGVRFHKYQPHGYHTEFYN